MAGGAIFESRYGSLCLVFRSAIPAAEAVAAGEPYGHCRPTALSKAFNLCLRGSAVVAVMIRR